jgi:hypothetical protein
MRKRDRIGERRSEGAGKDLKGEGGNGYVRNTSCV